MIWPFKKLKRQAQEIERLQNLLVKQVTSGICIDDLIARKGELSMTLSGSPIHIFADAFSNQFIQSKAENFIIMDFHHGDSGEDFEVTMQRVSGESLATQLNRLKSELAALKVGE